MRISFKFQEIDNLDHATYVSKFKAAVKKLKAQVNSPKTAVEVFIKQEHQFSNGATAPLVIFGKLASPWKEWAKDTIKANKKMTILGKGYVETDQLANTTFKFIQLKGDAKIDKIKKAAKTLLKAVKLELALVESIQNIEIEKEQEQESPRSLKLTPAQQEHKQKMDNRMAKMDEQLAKIMAQLKMV